MTRKQKTDEIGDNDDLQALFDSIAADVSVPEAEAKPAVAASATATAVSGSDDDSLQALFDEVSATFETVTATEPAEPAAAAPGDGADESGEVFNRIGQMTRQVHDTLRALGLDSESL